MNLILDIYKPKNIVESPLEIIFLALRHETNRTIGIKFPVSTLKWSNFGFEMLLVGLYND